MNKLVSANYWFGCDWWFYEVGYIGMRADQLSLACAGVYPWNTGHLRVTDPRMNSGFQQNDEVGKVVLTDGGYNGGGQYFIMPS